MFWVYLQSWISQGSVAQDSEYVPVLNVAEFWIHQDSEYASVFEYAMILNITETWIYQGYTRFRICMNNSTICMIVSRYVWICPNMPTNAWLCLNAPERLLFYISHFPICFTILFYLNTRLLIWTSIGDHSLKKQAVFLKRQNLIFSIEAEVFHCILSCHARVSECIHTL